MDMFLTAEEMIEMTGRQRSDAQVRVLKFMGIEHRIRPDGKVVVLRAHVESVFGIAPATNNKKVKEYKLDLSTIR